jgi:hypothetical protein
MKILIVKDGNALAAKVKRQQLQSTSDATIKTAIQDSERNERAADRKKRP